MDWLNLSGFQFDWLSFVLGALTGWLIEWLIDFFYWRRKRNHWEDTESALRSELDSTQGMVGDLRLQIAKDQDVARQLAATRALLDARVADVTQLQTAVENSNSQVTALEGQLNQSAAERELLADRHYAALAAVQSELDTLRTRLDQVTIEKQELENEIADLKSRNIEMEISGATRAVELAALSAAVAQATAEQPDDLTIIEGIGPKIEELLNQNDIRTFERLADTKVDDLTVILRSGGSHFNTADPETWPRQARLAANRDWTRLDALKAQLVGGVRKPAEATAEESQRTQAIEVPAADDLTIIEGIGPKIEELLNRNEIRTFEQLAATDVAALTAMLRSGGSQFNAADPETWPRQARLAANRDWPRLDALKAQLVGGVRRPVVEEEPVRAPAVVETPDDLTIVEGIGPKIEELLNKYGIRTFDELAASDIAELTAILRTGGSQFNMADPETWPRQAQLAANNEWSQLEALKAQLMGGVRRPAAEAEPTPIAPVAETPDDLTIIEGIGPKLAELLDENGIHTFARLARTDVLRLRIILDSGGSKFKQVDPSSWAEQAALAAAGEWGKLRELQAKLHGGR